MTIQREISIVIPVYNEVDNVKPLIAEITAVLSEAQFDYEIIFIDDGSQDATLKCLIDCLHAVPCLRVIAHKKNYGQSMALISGIKAASYAMIVTLDGDGQNDPADIPAIFELLQNERTIVLGNRVKRDDNQVRRYSSRIANWVRGKLLQDSCPDTGCSLKLFSRDAFLSLPHFNHMHRFLPALFMRSGYTLINYKVNHRPRLYGASKYGVVNRLFAGIYDLIGVAWLMKRSCNSQSTIYE